MRWTVITNCDSFFISKCDTVYYKLWQVLQIATDITKCDDYYKLRQNNVYYADQDFLRSISRKRPTSFIFKVSGRPLGGVSAMALNNILATDTHTQQHKNSMEGEPVRQTRWGIEPRLLANSNKKRGNFTKRNENRRQSKKKKQRRWQDKLWSFTWELGKPQGDHAPTSSGGANQ